MKVILVIDTENNNTLAAVYSGSLDAVKEFVTKQIANDLELTLPQVAMIIDEFVFEEKEVYQLLTEDNHA